jgi:F0F1-type ATP synthase delta subunit
MEIFSNNEIAEGIYLLIKDKSVKDLTQIMQRLVTLDKNRIFGQSEDLLINLKKNIHKQDEYKKDIILEIKKLYNAEEIIFNEFIDSKLLGGFKLEINNEIIDLSIQNKILKLKEHLIKKI